MKQWKARDDGFTGEPVHIREVFGLKKGEQSDPMRIRRFFYSTFRSWIYISFIQTGYWNSYFNCNLIFCILISWVLTTFKFSINCVLHFSLRVKPHEPCHFFMLSNPKNTPDILEFVFLILFVINVLWFNVFYISFSKLLFEFLFSGHAMVFWDL